MYKYGKEQILPYRLLYSIRLPIAEAVSCSAKSMVSFASASVAKSGFTYISDSFCRREMGQQRGKRQNAARGGSAAAARQVAKAQSHLNHRGPRGSQKGGRRRQRSKGQQRDLTSTMSNDPSILVEAQASAT